MILTKFHKFDVWHKIFEGQWKSKISFKKTVFRNFERFLPFLTFFSSQRRSLSLLRDENFFSLNRSNGASKNPSFCTDFKNVHMTLVKSAPKKSFSQKNILPIENLLKIYLGSLFTKVICTFLKSFWHLGVKITGP